MTAIVVHGKRAHTETAFEVEFLRLAQRHGREGALVRLARRKDLEAFRWLLGQHLPTLDVGRLLRCVVELNRAEPMRVLLETVQERWEVWGDRNRTDEFMAFCTNALKAAISADKGKAVDALLDRGLYDTDDNELLCLAAACAWPQALEECLRWGNQPNDPEPDGTTALAALCRSSHTAPSRRWAACAEILLRSEREWAEKNPDGPRSPNSWLDCRLDRSKVAIVPLLKAYGYWPDGDSGDGADAHVDVLLTWLAGGESRRFDLGAPEFVEICFYKGTYAY